jgi:ring-1,2-phenylacetyl-CoA epoxidase subunit PaaC
MSFDTAYEALTENNDARWAFGTGFDEPLAGVDTSVPEGVAGADLAAYCLMLGDDALIMSHRLQEWCAHAPELEDELALANIGLDLLGQARLLLARAGKADGSDRGEDDYAYLRETPEFRNVHLVEVTNADFGVLIARLLVFATWRLALLHGLVDSRDPVLAAIAAKGVKEVSYHRDYAAQWTVRLGDGTDFSKGRMQQGLDAVWPFVDELFAEHPVLDRLSAAGVAVAPGSVRPEFDQVIAQVLALATLRLPQVQAAHPGQSGRDGAHTDAMPALLRELQSVARAYPAATW